MSTFIAEIKPISPFTGKSRYGEETLRFAALTHGEWVAAHTEAPWGGSLEHLRSVRESMKRYGVDVPLLAKGVHASDLALKQALRIADFALVVGRWPTSLTDNELERLIVEPRGMSQVSDLLARGGRNTRLMWNARDLTTGERRADWHDVASLRGEYSIEWVCQASFIRSPSDVDPAANAHIVGTHLMDYIYGEDDESETGAPQQVVGSEPS